MSTHKQDHQGALCQAGQLLTGFEGTRDMSQLVESPVGM